MRFSFCISFIVLCIFSISLSLPLPPSGLYISFSDVSLGLIASTLTSDIENEINSYTGWPAESGSSSSASYTVSNWHVSVAMSGPQWKDISQTEFLIGWREFNFSISANYHVCARSWPNPCEDGTIQIYTTDSYTKLFLDTILDLTQSPPFANVSAADLSFDNNGIEVYVHCSNTFCVIPVNDIANAVAENFQTTFQNSVAKAARNAIETMIEKFKTEFILTDGLAIDMESNWWMLPGNTGGENGIIIVPTAGGFYTDVSGTISNPPFPPSITPPLNFLQDPLQEFNIVITEYFFQSLTWSLANLNFFNKVITASEVPAASPVKLSSNDPFFQQVVPGLTSYPNMDITITTTLTSIPVPTINSEALHIDGTYITFDFALSNSSYSVHGWTLSNEFNIDVQIVTAVAGNIIMFNSTIANFSSSVSVTDSNLGNITTDGFNTLYQLLESQIKLPGFAFSLPSTFSVSNPAIVFYDHYIGFSADFELLDYIQSALWNTISII